MINDIYKNYTMEQLKADAAVKSLSLETGIVFNVSFGTPPNYEFKTRKIRHHSSWGSWQTVYHVQNLVLPNDWYSRVYLNGIASVKYNGRQTVCLDAEAVDPAKYLREDLRLSNFEVYKVKLPYFKPEEYEYKPNVGMIKTSEAESSVLDRFMVASPVTNGSICFAGKYANSAASNLKKDVMKRLENAMDV